MPALKILGFDGVVPRTSPTMLGDSQAQTADNVKLYSKELRYWRGPLLTFTPTTANPATIYKLYSGLASDWLTWPIEVDVAPGPLADTTEARFYYTGDGTPKKSNWALAHAAPGGGTPLGAYPRSWQNMGVTGPATAPLVGVGTGTSGSIETRVYLYTYLNTFGSITEESAPSPASVPVNVQVGQLVNVTVVAPAVSPTTNITGWRLYRSVTGATVDNYEFVAELPIATLSYSDGLSTIQLGEVLPTIGWSPPPSDLAGLVSMPGGILAGFVGNTVYFSEPFFPHAWPQSYAITVPYPIIGLGVYGTSIVALTDRFPFIINGGIPSAMSTERVPIQEPCVAKGTIVSDKDGVLYASPNGLVSIGPSIRDVITRALFRRDEWQALLPGQMKGGTYDGKYFGVFPGQLPGKALVLSSDDVPALSYLNLAATALHVDAKTANLYFASSIDGKIYQVDADDPHPLNYEWKSKRFALPQATTFSALKCDAKYEQLTDTLGYAAQLAAIQAANQFAFASPLKGLLDDTTLNTYALNGSVLQILPEPASARTVQVVIYGEGEVVASLNLSSWNPVRLPSFKVRDVEIKIVGNVDVRSVQMATTVGELMQ